MMHQPLLDGPQEPLPSALAEIGAAGGGQGYITVGQLQTTTPDQALKVLSTQGVKTLGSLIVQDASYHEALGRDGDDLLTTGSDQYFDFDHEPYWRKRVTSAQATPQHKKGWSEQIPVLARVVAVKDACLPGKAGLLQLALQRFLVNDDATIFTIPAVEAVITFKWNAFARTALYLQLACYLVWLLGFTGFTWNFQDEDLKLTLPQLLDTPSGVLTVILEGMALLGMLPFIWIELCTITSYGVWQWATIWNVMDVSAYTLQVLITVVHLTRDDVASDWFSIVLSVQCLLLWAKVQYFSRVLQATSTSMVDTLKAVIGDVKYFLAFLVLTFYSFAASFHILFRKDQKEIEGFSTFMHTIGSIFAFATGGPDMQELWSSSLPTAATLLCIVYNFVMAVILLNLLIAVMSDSYSKIMEQVEGRYRCNQAQMIDELETTIPSWAYNYSAWCPTWVHFLQREADAREGEEDVAAAAGEDGDGGAGNTAGMMELGQRMSALEDAVKRLSGLLEQHLQAGNTHAASATSDQR